MLEFPDQIPLEAASGVVALWRDGSWKTKQRTLGKYVWNITGYGMGVGLKDGSDITPIGETVPPSNLGELCEALEGIHLQASAPQAYGVGPIISLLLMAAISEAVAFLKNWLGRK